MATTIYGIKTFKADGTTVVLQPSTPSAVYGQTFTLTDSPAETTGYTRRVAIPTRTGFFNYFKDFPEYTGRSIRPIQLRPGLHSWELGVGDGTNNSTIGVPYITWFRNTYTPGDAGLFIPTFSYTDTVLYVFVK
jgi:hypothetical protein